MKYTREWVAYVDDLTVRTCGVVDGKYLTDDQAEDEVRRACQNVPVDAVQPAGHWSFGFWIPRKHSAVQSYRSRESDAVGRGLSPCRPDGQEGVERSGQEALLGRFWGDGARHDEGLPTWWVEAPRSLGSGRLPGGVLCAFQVPLAHMKKAAELGWVDPGSARPLVG